MLRFLAQSQIYFSGLLFPSLHTPGLGLDLERVKIILVLASFDLIFIIILNIYISIYIFDTALVGLVLKIERLERNWGLGLGWK